ncbi:MAG: YfcE family phosphodiesterase [Magnetococcales bacterium]|nr:YfcE family phosphodiesterase [Magnetococcales bacterium]
MKIGIISDTHDHVQNVLLLAEQFRSAGVEHLIHAGDFGSPVSVRILSDFKVYGVFGNNDGEKFGLINAMKTIGGQLEGDFLSIKLGGKRIAVYHGTVFEITEALTHCGLYDWVVTGHTHVVVEKRVGKTLLMNPGSAHGFIRKPNADGVEIGPDGFVRKPTAMIVDTETEQIDLISPQAA